MSSYGDAPVDLGPFIPSWDEFMHYLYLPVRLPQSEDKADLGPCWSYPKRLAWISLAVEICRADALATTTHLGDPYIYVTARRGYATPGNPLNRPGWHCDDFGGTDLNYIWTDRYPTRYLDAPNGVDIPVDDAASMETFDSLAWEAQYTGLAGAAIVDMPVGHLMRLDPFVIHDTPVIPEPGGMRSFFKISISTHRYNLLGNSHNHGIDYDWPMLDRVAVRNQPGGNRDYVTAGDVS